jgi:hypothetical protein
MKRQSQRRRSHILSNQGWEKIKDAIWQRLKKCPDEYNFTELSEQTRLPESKPLDPETVSKILRREEGADLRSIKRLFGAFEQELEKSDYTCPPQSNPETCHLNQAIPAPLAKLSNVPNLPPNFLPRADELKAIKTAVLVSTNQSVAVTGTAHRVGVQGMGGIGKSVLTAAIAQDEEVRRAFPDGVLWVTLGQTPMLTKWQAHLAEVLGAGQRTFTDVQLGKAVLDELLADKACLLILDDVWHTKHVAAFDALGQRCKMLLTTRDRALITGLGAVECQLGVLSNEQALALLALWAGQHEETLPTEAHEVVRECGNLPLALAMIGAMVKGKLDRWANVLHKLRNADLEKIRHQFPNYPYSDLLKAIQVSVEDLEPDDQRRYLDFAVFPEDTRIPEAALQTFWEPEGLNKHDTQDVVDLLVERSLARRDDKGHLSLHDLQYDYVRKQAGDLSVLHNQLLSAYAKQCPNGWHTGTNDGYFFEHLAYHLKESEKKEELYSLLTESPDWMEAKFIACTGDAAYVADLELAISDFADPLEPNQLLRLIQLHTARRVVNQRVSCYEDIHLETLVWLGCEVEALNYAHLRSNAAEKFTSLFTIYNALREKGQPKNSVLEEAWKAAKDIRHVLIRAKVLSILAFTFAQAACQEQASIVFADVRKIVQKIKDELRAVQQADPVSANSNLADMLATFAMSLAQAGYQDEARIVFTEVSNITQKIGINWWRFLSLIALANSLALAEYNNEAYTTFLEAKYIAEKIDFLDIWMKSELVKTLVNMKRFPEARKMAVAISIKEPRAEVLTGLATALIQEKRFDEVEEVAQLIDIPWMQIAVLSQLSTALAHAGYEGKAKIAVTQARNIIQTIKENQIQAKAISYLAKALAQEGCKEESQEIFDEARKILHKIENNKEQVNLLKQLGLTLSLAGYKSEAKVVFNKAKYVLKLIEDNEQREIDLSGIGDALGQAGFFPETMEVFEEIQETDLQVGMIIELATALANTGEENKAIAVFADAEILAQAIEDSFWQALKLNDLAAALIETGYKDKAMAILEKAEVAVKKVEDGALQPSVLSELIKNLAEAGNFPKATSLARAIRHPSEQATALGNVANALVQAGCLSEAKELLKEIEDDKERIEQLGRLVIPLVEAENFFEAEKLAQDIEFPEQKSRMLCKLATALAQAGNEDKASAVFVEVRSLVQRHLATEGTGIKGVQINETPELYPFVYSELATSLAEAKRFTQALSSYNLQEGLNELLCALGNWRSTFEKVEPGLSVAVLREAIRIAGWMHPLWQEIYEVFPGRSTI